MSRAHSYSRAHSPTLPSLYLHQSSFSNLSVTLPMSQLILQPFRHFTYITAHSPTFCHFTYITAHSPTFPSFYLHHNSFSNPFIALPTSQLYAHSPTFPSLHLRHNSFSNSSVALPTSQLILQPFCCFTYVTVHSPALLSPHLRHKLFI